MENVASLGVEADPQTSLAHWLEQARQGDTEGMGRIYNRTSPTLFALALRILRRREDAEEAVLDVYTKAWQMAGRYDPGRGSVLAWLLTMTRTTSLDRIRSRTTREGRQEELPREPMLTDTGAGPEALSSGWQLHKTVRTALAQLPDEQREALEIAYFEDLSHSELAARLGIPLGTAKTRVRRGLLRLRTLIEGRI